MLLQEEDLGLEDIEDLEAELQMSINQLDRELVGLYKGTNGDLLDNDLDDISMLEPPPRR